MRDGISALNSVRDPPFGTPRTMTAGWLRTSRADCSGASALVGLLSAAFPLRDGARHPEWAAMRWLGSASRL